MFYLFSLSVVSLFVGKICYGFNACKYCWGNKYVYSI